MRSRALALRRAAAPFLRHTPVAAVRPASTTAASPVRNLMREAVIGLRPTDTAILQEVRKAIQFGTIAEAAVAIDTAATLHAKVPVADLIALLERATRRGYEHSHAALVKKLTNWVISSELEPLPSRPKRGPKAAPAAASLPSLDSAPAPSTDARASAAAAGVASSFSSLDATSPAPGSLSTPQFEALLAACATYRLADRALALFEHAVGSGWVPTRPALQAVAVALENKLPPPGRDPAARLAAYRAFLPLVAAARLPVDGELAASLVALLLGTSSSSGGGAHAAPPIAKAGAGAAPSPTLDALLDEAARLVAELPDVEVSRSSALQTLLLGCLRAGRRERAMATLGALQVRRVPLSSSLFNQLMYHETLGHSSASGGNNKLGAVQVYLELMQDSGVAPDAGTLLSLTHAFLASPPASAATSSGKGKSAAAATSVNDGTGVAAFVTAAAASLRVPLNHRVLGLAAFHAAKHGNVKELEAVLGLLRGMDWPADKPQPRWYRKLAAFLASHEVHA